ncbi:MAG: response regulator [Dehalococcoidia bacterium]|nr:response regulator [Dehalococcoidia bacterium]
MRTAGQEGPGPVTEATNGYLVLVVDDDESVRRVTMRALEAFGFGTLGAKDGYEAVDVLKGHAKALHCIIVDMSMPGMNGEQTLHALREVEAQVPVLLASGHSSEEMQDSYGGVGFAGYLQKPFQLAQLAQKVEGTIKQHQG